MSNLKPACEVFKFPKFTKASEALAMAKKILRNEKRWVQNHLAIVFEADSGDGEDYRACTTKSKNAQAFCALGAVQFVNGPAQKSAIAFLREAGKIVSGDGELNRKADNNYIFNVNDELGHGETMKMFTLAIKSARKAERSSAK